jgi:CubicO group peptidase (beta-lactamase class C family)
MGSPAGAQGLEVVEAAFREWAAQNNIARGVVAVSRERKLMLASAHGSAEPGAPVLLASLSKAVTGACIGTLVDAGKLAFDTPLGTVLAPFFQKNGEPADPRLKQATISQLLAHRAGFDRSGGDPATGSNLANYLLNTSVRDYAMTPLLTRMMRQKLAEPPGGAYYYTNASYLILGQVIETVSGQSYEAYCRGAVLRPLGINDARLDPFWGGVLSSYGGWQMTGPQYLRFIQAYDNDSKVLGPKSLAYLADGEGKWMNDRREIYYALGMQVRATTGGRNVWHSGAWTFRFSNPVNRDLRENHGTYAVSLARGVAWFASFNPRPADGQVVELDRAMSRALNAVKTWPETDLNPRFGL